MSTFENVTLWLEDAEIQRSAGISLAYSLYGSPLDILLIGELGTGKTTFLNGFAEGLGISEPVTSPTFALEQRYRTPMGKDVMHIDLYRLRQDQADTFLQASADHDGIRCIEWADRLSHVPDDRRIILRLAEKDDGRMLTVEFDDVPLPTSEDVERWRSDMHLPEHVIAHSAVVTDVATTLADYLLKRGRIVRRLALERAAQLHDLLRFIDFSPHTTPAGIVHATEHELLWSEIRKQCNAMSHEEACAAFLTKQGCGELGSIVVCHGAKHFDPHTATIEQQLLYYADKRALDRVVTVEQRYEEFVKRYGPDTEAFSRAWRDQALKIERDLFPEGAPI